jgi:hypothetical protein
VKKMPMHSQIDYPVLILSKKVQSLKVFDERLQDGLIAATFYYVPG